MINACVTIIRQWVPTLGADSCCLHISQPMKSNTTFYSTHVLSQFFVLVFFLICVKNFQLYVFKDTKESLCKYIDLSARILNE